MAIFFDKTQVAGNVKQQQLSGFAKLSADNTFIANKTNTFNGTSTFNNNLTVNAATVLNNTTTVGANGKLVAANNTKTALADTDTLIMSDTDKSYNVSFGAVKNAILEETESNNIQLAYDSFDYGASEYGFDCHVESDSLPYDCALFGDASDAAIDHSKYGKPILSVDGKEIQTLFSIANYLPLNVYKRTSSSSGTRVPLSNSVIYRLPAGVSLKTAKAKYWGILPYRYGNKPIDDSEFLSYQLSDVVANPSSTFFEHISDLKIYKYSNSTKPIGEQTKINNSNYNTEKIPTGIITFKVRETFTFKFGMYKTYTTGRYLVTSNIPESYRVAKVKTDFYNMNHKNSFKATSILAAKDSYVILRFNNHSKPFGEVPIQFLISTSSIRFVSD